MIVNIILFALFGAILGIQFAVISKKNDLIETIDNENLSLIKELNALQQASTTSQVVLGTIRESLPKTAFKAVNKGLENMGIQLKEVKGEDGKKMVMFVPVEEKPTKKPTVKKTTKKSKK